MVPRIPEERQGRQDALCDKAGPGLDEPKYVLGITTRIETWRSQCHTSARSRDVRARLILTSEGATVRRVAVSLLTEKAPPAAAPAVLPPRLWPLLLASEGCAANGSTRLPMDPLRGSRALAELPAASSAASMGASYAKRDADWLACSPAPPAAADCAQTRCHRRPNQH